MMDQKQEAGTLTLGERMVLAARLAVQEHLRQSVIVVPPTATPNVGLTACDIDSLMSKLRSSSRTLAGAL